MFGSYSLARPVRAAAVLLVVAYYCLALVASPAHAGAKRLDSDHDGIPNHWESVHGLNPNRAADAAFNPDHDGLTNLAEFQNGTDPQVSDTDSDGLSDGSEVNDFETDPTDSDTDDDGVVDGEDDSNDDGIADQDEDGDNGQGESDVAATIVSFDPATGLLTMTSSLGDTVTGTVTADTEIQWDGDCQGDSAATTADLLPNAQITELEFEDGTTNLASVDLMCSGDGGDD
jgi:hypothetical protein